MDVLQRSNTLQRYPILKPNHTVSAQPFDKGSFDEVFDDLATLICHIASGGVRGDGSFAPDDDMCEIWRESIGPVIDKDLVVRWIVEGDVGDVAERRTSPWKLTLNEKVCHTAILFIDIS